MARRDELEPWVLGYHQTEEDDIISAVGDMVSSFPSTQGQSDAQAAANLGRLLRSLAPFPLWAIDRVCERIRRRGYTKIEGGRYVTERHWPPSDAEVIELVEQEIKIYQGTHATMAALLAAEVET